MLAGRSFPTPGLEVAKFMAKLKAKNSRQNSFVYLVKFLTYIIILLSFYLKIYNFLEITMLELTNLLQYSALKFGIAPRGILKKGGKIAYCSKLLKKHLLSKQQ